MLNRFRGDRDDAQTVHVIKYMFPRQFGLHNVFTSAVDHRETAHPLKDYTMREQEIARADTAARIAADAKGSRPPAVMTLPRRLRGEVFALVGKMRVRQRRCAYKELMRHYCPPPDAPVPDAQQHVTELATPHAQVSAFCRAAVSNVFPFSLLGETDATGHNWALLTRAIDQFVRMRRFESMTLAHVLLGMQVKKISWLCPAKCAPDANLSRTDHAKRLELLAELLYYMFDSFVIPLVRAHFYVTESSAHRNVLFYFRHDVWRRLARGAAGKLKSEMLEEIRAPEAKTLLNERTLGFSHIRFLPKRAGMRPITNLKRRCMVVRQGKRVLGRSINSAMAPAFHVLTHEKVCVFFLLTRDKT